MIKISNFVSIAFHPLFLAFYNFLFFILIGDAHGAALGFVITLFFLAGVMIPVFYTFAIIYNERKQFEWTQMSDMSMLSRKKLLAYSIIYNVLFLLFVLNLNDAFLGIYKPMFSSVLMGFIFLMMMSFILYLSKIKISLHALSVAFFFAFCLIFSWNVPGLSGLENKNSNLFLIFAGLNFIALVAVVWARLNLKAHTKNEIGLGILIGIFSPILLTLLTYAI